ncbi:MAG: hypothetical protein KF912_00395 [Phycisphaeraceae bacterium]|nr:hypothetical protein [Phycisphaeraceae bacterium]MBX3365757.1 hypothetical protein [Phycisphaeraceae bacterium]
MIDPSVIPPLGLHPASVMQAHTPSTDGQPIEMPVYDLSIWLYHAKSKHTLVRSFPVACAGLRSQGIDMLLGRDMLNECLLIYDGPARKYTISF